MERGVRVALAPGAEPGDGIALPPPARLYSCRFAPAHGRLPGKEPDGPARAFSASARPDRGSGPLSVPPPRAPAAAGPTVPVGAGRQLPVLGGHRPAGTPAAGRPGPVPGRGRGRG